MMTPTVSRDELQGGVLRGRLIESRLLSNTSTGVRNFAEWQHRDQDVSHPAADEPLMLRFQARSTGRR